MKSKFILASVVSLTLAGVAPVVMAADRNDSRNDSRIDARDEHRIPYSQVPGEAKRAIEPQLNSGDKVTDAWKYQRGDKTVYVVTTNDERIIRADDRGNLISVKSTDDDNTSATGSNRVAVKYNSLPRNVKDTLGKEAKGHPMEIWQVTHRDGQKLYVATIDDNDGTRRVRVDNDGNLLEKPVLLADRGNDNDFRNGRIDNKDEREIDARRRQDRAKYESQGQHIKYSEVPGKVKSTVGSEMGQNTQVGDVMKINRNGNTVYRVELENETTARTIWVDDSGKLMKEMNDTEEGRKRVDISDLPGPVKSAMINEAHGKEPKRIWQVTRNRDTWYVGEAEDGHLVNIDDNGKVMSHDSHPKLLSDRNDNNARNDSAAERNRNRDNDDKKYEKAREIEKRDQNKIDFNDMPKAARDTVHDNLKNGEKVKEVFKTHPENGDYHFIVRTSDDRVIRIGEHGALLGQTR